MNLEKIAPQARERWEQAAHPEQHHFIRLAIARELQEKAHALRTRLMTEESKSETDTSDLKALEAYLDQAQDTELHRLEFSDVLLMKKAKPSPKPQDKSTLFTLIEKEKINRFDRKWAFRIALNALAEKWNFWRFESNVEVTQVENFHTQLVDGLWPQAVLLFVESAVPSEANAPSPNQWRGAWFFTATSDFLPIEGYTQNGNWTQIK